MDVFSFLLLPVYKHKAKKLKRTAHHRAFRGRAAWAAWGLLISTTLFAGSATAQTTTYVSNLGQTAGNDANVGGITPTLRLSYAQRFDTGPTSGGYDITEVVLDLASIGTNSEPVVSIYTTSSGSPGTLLYSLTTPSSLVSGDNVFTAPANASLSANTNYFVVVENTRAGTSTSSRYRIGTTLSGSEDSGKSSGWNINNNSLIRESNGGSWNAADPTLIVRFAIRATPVDATLSALSLEDSSNRAIILSPAFDADTTSYTAAVATGVGTVTVLGTPTDSSATVAYLDENDIAITDTSNTDDGLQFEPSIGSNTVKVEVTGADNATTETYTVVLVRTGAADVLISNLGQTAHVSLDQNVGSSTGIVVTQEFTTGDDGYVLTAAQIDVKSVSIASANPVARICPRGTGNFPDTANCVGSLTTPGSFETGTQEFRARGPGLTLAANTQYFLVLSLASGAEFYVATTTTSDSEDAGGESGWSIANVLRRSESGGAYTSGTLSTALRIAIKGASADPVPLGDASLDTLSLTDGGGTAITLNPAFDTDTFSYTVSVANSVSSVTVLPTTGSSSATVEYLNESNNDITDTDSTTDGLQFSPAVGSNTVKVRVTAADSTIQDYTVVIERASNVTVLISNLGKASGTALTIAGTQLTIAAQEFTTGSQAVILRSAQIRIDQAPTNGSPIVRLCPRGSGTRPDVGNCLATLSNPSTISAGVMEFTASGTGVMLPAQGKYFLVISKSNPTSGFFNVATTSADSEDAGGEAGWSIANAFQISTNGGAFNTPTNLSARIAIKGTADTNTDATLSALSLTDDGDNTVTLNPTFGAGTTSYTASVANDVSSVTVMPTPAYSSATVAYLDENGAHTDDDDTEEGHQFSLDVGSNTVKVEVTAADSVTTEIYTVVITRAATSTTTTVTQTGGSATWTLTGPSAVTADGTYTYTITLASGTKSINEYVGFYLPDSATNQDTLGLDPDNCVSPKNFCASFAGGGTTNAAVWNNIQSHDTISKILSNTSPHTLTATLKVAATTPDDTEITFGAIENNGAPRSGGMTITVGDTTAASTDATLSGLELQDTSDDSTIAISPTFAANGTSYIASVGKDVDEIFVDPTTNDDGATVEYLDASDLDIPDADSTEEGHQVALVGGINTIKVKVTAEDGMTEETYTVGIARARDCPTGNEWCAEMTSGSFLNGFVPISGFSATGSDDFGALDDTDFVHGGQTFEVSQIRFEDSPVVGNDSMHFDLNHYLPFGTKVNLGGTVFTADSGSRDIETGNHGWSAGISDPNWFEGRKVTVSLNLPPLLQTATVSGAKLELVYHEALDSNSVPAASDFSVSVAGGSGATPSDVALDGKTVTLTLASAVTSGQTVEVTYTVPGSNPIQDEYDIEAPGFTDFVAAHSMNASLSALILSGGGSTITLSPAFDAVTTSYTASVASGVNSVTVLPTTDDGNATVAYADENGMDITDTDMGTAGLQFRPEVGANTINVKVTARTVSQPSPIPSC